MSMSSTQKLIPFQYGIPMPDTPTHANGRKTSTFILQSTTQGWFNTKTIPSSSVSDYCPCNNLKPTVWKEKPNFFSSINRPIGHERKSQGQSLCSPVHLFSACIILLHGLLVMPEFMLNKKEMVSVLTSTSVKEKPDCDLNQRCLNYTI